MKKNPLYKSFGYAFQGISNTIRTERNIKIHCAAAMLVTIFGIWLQISKTEWMICFILFELILALELMNTAVEATVDLCTEDRRPLAKKAKDAAAGAVLLAAIFAAVIGLMIFIPRLLGVFGL